MFKSSKIHGLNLVEFIVALAVVGILALVAYPTFTTLIKKHRVSTATENLYADLQYARSEAVKRNANVYVSFTTGDSWCYGINPNSACNCTVPNNCTLGVTSAPAPAKLSLSTTGLTGNNLYFEGSHGAANASGSITFTLYGDTPLMKITVGRLGASQICSTGIGGYTAC